MRGEEGERRRVCGEKGVRGEEGERRRGLEEKSVWGEGRKSWSV